MDAPDTKSLPDNAYEPLKPGEVYQPIVPAATTTFPKRHGSLLSGGFCSA